MDRIASADACDDLQNGQFGKRAGEMPGLVLTCLISIIGPRSEVVSSSCERYAADRTLRAPACGVRDFCEARGCSSVGRASRCQRDCRRFESDQPLFFLTTHQRHCWFSLVVWVSKTCSGPTSGPAPSPALTTTISFRLRSQILGLFETDFDWVLQVNVQAGDAVA